MPQTYQCSWPYFPPHPHDSNCERIDRPETYPPYIFFPIAFKAGLSNDFEKIIPNNDIIYFLYDTREIYKGHIKFGAFIDFNNDTSIYSVTAGASEIYFHPASDASIIAYLTNQV